MGKWKLLWKDFGIYVTSIIKNLLIFNLFITRTKQFLENKFTNFTTIYANQSFVQNFIPFPTLITRISDSFGDIASQ